MDGTELINDASGWLQQNLPLDHDSSWMLLVFLIVLSTLIVAFIAAKFFDKAVAQAARTRNEWDDILLGAARKPVIFFIWLMGASWSLQLIDGQTGTVLLDVVQPLRKVAVIALLGWFLTRFVQLAERSLVDPEGGIETTMDATTVGAFGKLLRLSIIITIGLVILQSFGYSISGVLAFGGIGGLAVGFAAKDLLANFFGGLMVYLDRPFKVGDWVRSPDKEIEGTVEHIGWRLTRIRTFDKRPLYVPNSTFTSISVENPSRMSNRRIYETVGVRYCDVATVSQIVTDVKAMLQAHPDIDTRQTLIVNLNKFAPSSLDFFIYTFTKTVDWVKFHEVKQDVLLKVMTIIEQHGAEVAFPTTTVHLIPEPPAEHSRVDPL